MVRKGPQKPRPRLTLHQQMVSEAMQQRYAKAVLCFLTFLADSDLPSATIVHLCEAASEWVEFLYADGERKGLASDGLAGLQYYLPRCQAKLKLAWKLVKVLAKGGATHARFASESISGFGNGRPGSRPRVVRGGGRSLGLLRWNPSQWRIIPAAGL